MLGLDFAGLAELTLIQTGDGEDAVTGQDIAKHTPVARLEDMKRKQGLGEKRDVGQSHDRHFVRHCDFHFHKRKLARVRLNTTETQIVPRVCQLSIWMRQNGVQSDGLAAVYCDRYFVKN
jgi:hypothetical protein